MKLCYACTKRKPLDDFAIDKKARDGRKGICKECVNKPSAYRPVYCHPVVKRFLLGAR